MHYNYASDYYPMNDLIPIYEEVINAKYECLESGLPIIMPNVNPRSRSKYYAIKVGENKYYFSPYNVSSNSGTEYTMAEVANMLDAELQKKII